MLIFTTIHYAETSSLEPLFPSFFTNSFVGWPYIAAVALRYWHGRWTISELHSINMSMHMTKFFVNFLRSDIPCSFWWSFRVGERESFKYVTSMSVNSANTRKVLCVVLYGCFESQTNVKGKVISFVTFVGFCNRTYFTWFPRSWVSITYCSFPRYSTGSDASIRFQSKTFTGFSVLSTRCHW